MGVWGGAFCRSAPQRRGTHTHTHRNTHTQERTRECCTYPLATYLKGCRNTPTPSLGHKLKPETKTTFPETKTTFPWKPAAKGKLKPNTKTMVLVLAMGRVKVFLHSRTTPLRSARFWSPKWIRQKHGGSWEESARKVPANAKEKA